MTRVLFHAGSVALLSLAGCAAPAGPADAPGVVALDSSFSGPRAVTIRGYEGDAMEPFVTADGRFLLFNNRNDPSVDTQLHAARAVDETTFDYVGPLAAANSPALDAVPTADGAGRLYFISTRSYDASLSTVYVADFVDGAAGTPVLVDGLPRRRGDLIFDVDVSRDGSRLVYATGVFRGGSVPEAADLSVAIRTGDTFSRSEEESARLASVNTPAALEYAAAISPDLRELIFTRFRPGGEPQIFRATRSSPTQPFGAPARVAAAAGHVEAPTISPDGRGVYYHALVAGRFRIFRIDRR